MLPASSPPRHAFHLTTLGTLAISEDAEAIRKSRRSLALLALAAAGGPNGVERAAVLGLLWPDSDTDRAANSFRQLLHGIRRDLGDGALVYEGGFLRLNPALFIVDRWDLEHAIAERDAAQIASIYRGPFLGSFYVSGLAEFERWADQQRDGLRQLVLSTLRELASRAAAERNQHEAVQRWRWIVEIDPVSSANALGLLRALASAGDRSGALAFAHSYEALIRRDLETEPDAAISTFVATLRQTPVELTAVPAPLAPSRPVAARIGDATSIYSESLYTDPHAPALPPGERRASKTPKRERFPAILGRRSVGAGLAAAAVFGAATASLLLASPRRFDRPSANVVAVLPFHIYDQRDSTLSASLAALLSANLDDAGGLQAVSTATLTNKLRWSAPTDPVAAARDAEKLGAGIVVTGEVIPRERGVRLALTLRDSRSGQPIGNQVAVDSDTSRLRELVDEVAGQLIAQRYLTPRDHVTHSALRSTRSVDALKAYLKGETALREGRYVDAADEFTRATTADTTFALGFYRLATSAEWSGRTSDGRRAMDLAIRNSDRLDDRDRRLIAALAAFRGGNGAEAERQYRAILDDYPNDAEAWFQLAEVRFHTGPLRGESATNARPALERLLLLDSTNVEAIVHLARIASLDGKPAEAVRLQHRLGRIMSAPYSLEQRAFRLFALVDGPGSYRATLDLERKLPAIAGRASVFDVATSVDDFDGIERVGHVLVDASASPTSRAFGLRLLAHAALAQGQWRAARVDFDSAMSLNKDLAISQLSLAATMPFVPIDQDELQKIYSVVNDWRPTFDHGVDADAKSEGLDAMLRLHRLGVLSVRLHELPRARDIAKQLDALASTPRGHRYAYALAQSIRARASADEGHVTEALAALDAADWEGPASIFAAEAGDRYFRAMLLEALGRTREAMGWYGSIAERSAYELPYLAPSQLRLAGMKRAAGDVSGARASEARARQLWRNADPSLKVALR
jgi:DNA-binding SARP family transcriptional activator/TolB-like protein